MKLLHRPDLYGWSQFDNGRNIDFNSVLWVRENGNVVFDPLPQSAHDLEHLQQLGGARYIVVTNSDHVRDTERLQSLTGAEVLAPAAERDNFPIRADQWLADGDEPLAGLVVYVMTGSKTPGELALLLDGSTLITGDLIRSHAAGRLDILPIAKLAHESSAKASVRRIANLSGITSVLTGDGWPVFRDGGSMLRELAARL